ncbi:putative bifunctional diguanylate cyclase/phosphodiesterase [Leptothoe sp. PORK10 BA2]|uniref:putative bifunctional diguanylate cyclase/phosphodiesterase n=1 Tax=Leptothoe sp. PORK10 BA2 TaxID=3110254 RepID=UPI002B209F92|nr:EAL domain-containing protein [Leptothoe sp. PORK10 BA2]MEA5465382.1 EAL domain-containing protein [Leptothoe sp. PORK10 BA2]
MGAWLVPVYAIANAIVAILCIALILLCPRNQGKPDWGFRFLLAISAFWNLIAGCSALSQSPAALLLWAQLHVFPIALIPPLWLIFILVRVGYRWRWVQSLLFVVPAATMAITWHPLLLPWMWRLSSFHQLFNMPVAVYERGLWFQFVHTPYSYGLFLAGMALLVRVILESPPIQRGEFQLLLGLTFSVGMVNVVTLSPLGQKFLFFDPTPVGWTLVWIVYCVCISRRSLLQTSPLVYRQIFAGLDTAILVMNRDRQLLEYNNRAKKDFNLSPQNLMSQVASLLPFVKETHWRLLQHQSKVECVDVDIHWCIRETPIVETTRFKKSFLLGYILSLDDVSEEYRLQAQLLEGALLYDPLTELPNRTLLLKRLETALEQEVPLAILFLDLDRFKSINDSLGHRAGDYLLQQMAKQMQSCLRSQDMLARFGGDEFAILMEDVDQAGVLGICDRIQAAIHTPVAFEGYQLLVSASIGVAFAHIPSTLSRDLNSSEKATATADRLIRDADLAMYKAKTAGKACHRVYNDVLHQQAMAAIEMETALRQALEQDQFELYYQPIIEIKSETMVGVEALLRWHHPHHGLLSPPVFIPIAENLGIMSKLDTWVILAACRQYQQWQTLDQSLMVGVNVSANNWGTQALIDVVKTGLAGQNGDWLKLEISEDTLLGSATDNAWAMDELKNLGVDIQLDDFGTGYSSLSYLCQIRCDGLKIDKSFVQNLVQLPQAYVLVKTIVDLAHSLNLTVVAEGIETRQQWETLKALGCAWGQGYLWSQPLPAKELETKFMHRFMDQRI